MITDRTCTPHQAPWYTPIRIPPHHNSGVHAEQEQPVWPLAEHWTTTFALRCICSESRPTAAGRPPRLAANVIGTRLAAVALGRISPGMLTKIRPLELHDSAQNAGQAQACPEFREPTNAPRVERRDGLQSAVSRTLPTRARSTCGLARQRSY